MRISIWKQFSSNHSSDFDLVAKFRTSEDAKNAYTILHDIIWQIAKWYKDHADEFDLDEELRKSPVLNPTPIEDELAEKYNLKTWEYSIDWAVIEADERLGNRGLYLYENLLFLMPAIDTWTDQHPFAELLEKLGARIEVFAPNTEFNSFPVINLTCLAPNSDKAEEIVKQVHTTETYSDGSVHSRIKLPTASVPYGGAISYTNVQIECKNIQTTSHPAGHAAEFLPRLVAYLEAEGCHNFEFDISTIPWS